MEHRIIVDNKRLANLSKKLNGFGQYAVKEGLKSSSIYMNTGNFLESMYPPSKSGSPFTWSSDKQRKAFFASNGFGRGIPTVRKYTLVSEGKFTVNKNLMIEFDFPSPYKYVISPSSQIIGHNKRGWKVLPAFIRSKSAGIVKAFKNGANQAWKEMDKFITGGGAGL
jgi:hypothetical protein